MNLKNKEEKIRIAFVDVVYNSFYGAQQSMITLMEGVDHNKYQPVLITTGEGVLAQQYRDAGLDVQIIPISPTVNVFGKKVTRYSVWKKIHVLIELLRYNFAV